MISHTETLPYYLVRLCSISDSSNSSSSSSSSSSDVVMDLPRLILIGESFFPKFPKFGNNWRYVSTYIRRRFVTIREILQKKKKTSSSLPFQYLEKKQENMED